MIPRPDQKIILFFGTVLGLLTATTAFSACMDEVSRIDGLIDQYKSQKERAGISEEDAAMAQKMIDRYVDDRMNAERRCNEEARFDREKQTKVAKDREDCEQRRQKFPDAWAWDSIRNHCVNKAEAKSLSYNDECSSASVFTGQLKGQNCKNAQQTVKDVKARNSALVDATTAATTAYSGLQATGATGAQNDAQTRQANIMKTLAMSKMATAALSLSGAMQLKSAATAAEQANSTITGAQKALRAECNKIGGDEESCFYQNAPKFGIAADQRSYANFERMNQAAQQSQDQADVANALAKSSLITGGADLLVGLQAMKAAQLANNNAAKMAPPPLIAPPPPMVNRFGNNGSSTGTPSLEPGVQAGLSDYGKAENGGSDFGNQSYGRIEGSMVPSRMGAPNGFKAAASGVSGGGGGGGAGGNLRGGSGGGAPKSNARKGGTALGEYSLAGGPSYKGGNGNDKADPSNPLTDMLAKLFPQDQAGKPVVDARQIASGSEFTENSHETEQQDGVTPSELSIFEQISVKYRQLNGSGRF